MPNDPKKGAPVPEVVKPDVAKAAMDKRLAEVRAVREKGEVLYYNVLLARGDEVKAGTSAAKIEADAKATYDAAMASAVATRSKARQGVVDAEAALQAHSDATEKALGFPLQYEPVATGGGGRTRL